MFCGMLLQISVDLDVGTDILLRSDTSSKASMSLFEMAASAGSSFTVSYYSLIREC